MRIAGSTVAIAGLGLIGGSLARDLAAAGARILAFDRDVDSLRDALDAGVVHALMPPDFAGVEGADAFVLALPVDVAPAALIAAAPRLARVPLLTDVGSTKRSIVAAAERLGLGVRFVGGHPLAGDHRAGWRAARIGLFAGARVFLCPAAGARDDAIERARALWLAVGARPEFIDAGAHDERLAWASHLPQAASSALARALAAAGLRPTDLGPGGRDTTRLAASDPALWTAIALDNAPPIAAALERLETELATLRAALLRRDRDAVHAFFAAGRQWHEGAGER